MRHHRFVNLQPSIHYISILYTYMNNIVNLQLNDPLLSPNPE